MKAGDYIRLTKISGSKDADVKDGHWTFGILTADIAVGSKISVARISNIHHPHGMPGIFLSSPVVSVEKAFNRITTANSVYYYICQTPEENQAINELIEIVESVYEHSS